MKLSLNFNLPEQDHEAVKRVQQAHERKTIASETMEQAWVRLFKGVLTPLETEHMFEVQKAMVEGKLHRSNEKVGKMFSKNEALALYHTLQKIKQKELRQTVPNHVRFITKKEELEPFHHAQTIVFHAFYEKQTLIGITLYEHNIPLTAYIPAQHVNYVKEIAENKNIQKVMYEAKSVLPLLRKNKVNVNSFVHDIKIAQHLLNENEKSFELPSLASSILHLEQLPHEKVNHTTSKRDLLWFAWKETSWVWDIYKKQTNVFEKEMYLKKMYEKVEHQMIDVVMELESTGFVLDESYTHTLKKEVKRRIKEAENVLTRHLGSINFQSHKQVKEKLEQLLGITLEKTDKETLTPYKYHHEAVKYLLSYKKLTNLLSTYIEALPKQIAHDGRVHGSFNQNGAKTGRFSSALPNLQSIPIYARKLLVAPQNMVLVSGDFASQEPRFLAHFSGEEALIESFKQGVDIYSSTASDLFNVPIEQCGEGTNYRSMMKYGFLAVMYGTGSKTLAGQLNITEKEAETFIRNFYKKYPKVKTWIETTIQFAKKHGYVYMIGGRKRRVPGINSTDTAIRKRAERQCVNAVIQGSAAIQTKMTMLKLYQLCQKKGWKMALTVHDEIGVYAPNTLSSEDVRMFEHVFLNTVKLNVPNQTSLEISTRWGCGVSVKEWFNQL